MAHLDDDLQDAVKATMVITAVLFFKFFISNFMLGGKKLEAGKRAPEDTYQKQPEGEELHAALEALDRAQRIVNNDLENIPLTLIIAWGCVVALLGGFGSHKTTVAHTVMICVFGVCRVLHTITYSLRLALMRSLVWFVAVLATAGLAINGLVIVFD